MNDIKQRDKLEQMCSDDPLWAAEEMLRLLKVLEQIESLAHEDSSDIAHRALAAGRWHKLLQGR